MSVKEPVKLDQDVLRRMSEWTSGVPLDRVPTPCFVVDEPMLRRNLRLLSAVESATGCRVLLALKGFSLFHVFPVIREYLCGTTASGLDEARLGREEFGGEVHVGAPAYRDGDIDEILAIADHIVFNSMSQWERFGHKATERGVECGLRLNPEHSEVDVAIYDPCRPGSRMGITAANFPDELPREVTGLHFHTLCELGADSLERTLAVVEKKFGRFLSEVEWVNFGGGHHITRPGYDVERLCRLLVSFRERYGVTVYLEPGEAVALYTGVLVASVLDVIENGGGIAILDTSASAHMPDVLEMPYRPVIAGAGEPGEYDHDYRLGGMTCLAGDEIGTYSFPEPLKPGDRLVFLDMGHYSMVKTTTFNGIRHPSIAVSDSSRGTVRVVRNFGYADFKSRLG